MGGDLLKPRPAPAIDLLADSQAIGRAPGPGEATLPPMRIVTREDGSYRNADASGAELPSGDEFALSIMDETGWEREQEILRQIEAGNIPAFLRQLAPVKVEWTDKDGRHEMTFYAMPDYLAIGTDESYMRVPMSPATAQALADKLGMHLPTARMVDEIYNDASVKLAAKPRDYSNEGHGLHSRDADALRNDFGPVWDGKGNAQTSTAAYHEQNGAIDAQLQAILDKHNDTPGADRKDNLHGQLIAGHGKDIVLSTTADPNAIQFYGWYKDNGQPIQAEAGKGNPVNGHKGDPFYVDYSHKVRLVGAEVEVDGRTMPLEQALRDPALARHLSSQGAFTDAHPPRVPEKQMDEARQHGIG